VTKYLYDIVALSDESRIGPFSKADALASARHMNLIAGKVVVDIAISFDNDPADSSCQG